MKGSVMFVIIFSKALLGKFQLCALLNFVLFLFYAHFSHQCAATHKVVGIKKKEFGIKQF